MGVTEHATTCTDLPTLYPADIGVQHVRPPVAASGEGNVRIDTVHIQYDDGFNGLSRALSNCSLPIPIGVKGGRMREE